MTQQMDDTNNVNSQVTPRIMPKRKSEFGQFMTPSSVARFMVEMFPTTVQKTCHLLDAGAGVGALSCAFLDRWVNGGFYFKKIEVTAYEVDNTLCDHLVWHLNSYNRGVKSHVITGDYIELATADGLKSKGYTHAVLNPPYRKINSNSIHRLALSTVGIETVNLYSAFVALAVAEAVPGAQIVAIIPRSFCNGAYYKPFRDFILERAAIRHMHLFDSRSKVFKDDKVLQENIIIRLECAAQQGAVTITTSTDDSFTDVVTNEHSFERIVFPDDPERFIHVPTTNKESTMELLPAVRYTLDELGIKVSTGPVVDFRLKEHLRDMPEDGTVPLVYPCHLGTTGMIWPRLGLKKPNAILRNASTEKWFYPNGFYCVVRRFSSKEEKRRVMASFVDPATFGDHTVLGFENHMNLFHANKRGLNELLARGLSVFLNATAVDENFRRFSGHTQVNVTDLKRMRYPSLEALNNLGKWAIQHSEISQEMIDEQLWKLVA